MAIRCVPNDQGGSTVVGWPTHCVNGHALKGNQTRTWMHCPCTPDTSGHYTVRCWTCDHTHYDPPCTEWDNRGRTHLGWKP